MQMDEYKTACSDRDHVGKSLFDLAERFRRAQNPEEIRRLGEILGLLIFGGHEKP